jgi:hypothetical protein
MTDQSMADDTLAGVVAIAAYIGKTERQTYHLLETCQLPAAFKLGDRWHLRKSAYRRRIEQLETEGAGGARRV